MHSLCLHNDWFRGLLAQMGEAGVIRIAHLKNKDIHGEELPSQVG